MNLLLPRYTDGVCGRIPSVADMNHVEMERERGDERDVFDDDEEEEEEGSKVVEAWQKQVTARGVVASVLIGSVFSVIAMKLNLTTGITPNLNVSAALIAFILIRTWTKVVEKLGMVSAAFTKQENTMIQTCVVACYSIAVGGN